MKNVKKASKWKDDFFAEAYRLAKDGLSNEQIAKQFRVSTVVFNKWMQTKPALKKALVDGRHQDRQHLESFRNFIYGRLTPKAKRLWDELDKAERAFEESEGTDDRRDAVIELFATQGKKLRQQLFIHALVTSNFQPSIACRRTGISVNEVREWAARDRGFAELLKGVHDCKKDFFESALMDLVAKRDSAAVIFVNKTVNRDRGYGDVKDDVRRVQHEHRIMLDDLPVDVKRAILENIQRKQVPLIEDHSKVTDVELE